MKAFAYVVAPEKQAGAALKDLSRQAGFETVHDFTDIAAAERQALQTPLLYFLFSAVPRPFALKPIAQAIRAAASPRVRFAPIIYFAETPSIEVIKSCINMGFDDVIALPVGLGALEERLERQIARPLVYFETATYFGPDRRGRLEQEEGHSLRGTGGEYRRLEIIRSPAGINVIKDDQHIMI
jgi:DNA-binding response OmpR family regulator